VRRGISFTLEAMSSMKRRLRKMVSRLNSDGDKKGVFEVEIDVWIDRLVLGY
jgi:hypothetical protein